MIKFVLAFILLPIFIFGQQDSYVEANSIKREIVQKEIYLKMFDDSNLQEDIQNKFKMLIQKLLEPKSATEIKESNNFAKTLVFESNSSPLDITIYSDTATSHFEGNTNLGEMVSNDPRNMPVGTPLTLIFTVEDDSEANSGGF